MRLEKDPMFPNAVNSAVRKAILSLPTQRNPKF